MSKSLDDLLSENDIFLKKAHDALYKVFEQAQSKDEVQFALAMFPEMRGSQAAGWNTAPECQNAYNDYLQHYDQLEDGSRIKTRISLALYCHLAEAGGFYEIPKNMMNVCDGTGFRIRPFDHLVDIHKITGERIAPSATRIMKDLMGHAKIIEATDLSEVFRDLVNADIRNGFAHADYIIAHDGIRFPKRNGGVPSLFSNDVYYAWFKRLIDFIPLMWKVWEEFALGYNPEKFVTGHLNDEQVFTDLISYDPQRGVFGFSGQVSASS